MSYISILWFPNDAILNDTLHLMPAFVLVGYLYKYLLIFAVHIFEKNIQSVLSLYAPFIKV